VQHANLSKQAPLTPKELAFIYHYPTIARQLLTVAP